MSQHHLNREAYHDPRLWAWSEKRKCWVRCTDTVLPGDIRAYDYDGTRWVFVKEEPR